MFVPAHHRRLTSSRGGSVLLDVRPFERTSRLGRLAGIVATAMSCAPHYVYVLPASDAARLPAAHGRVELQTPDFDVRQITVDQILREPGTVRVVAAERSDALRRGALYGAISGAAAGTIVLGVVGRVGFCFEGCTDVPGVVAASSAAGFGLGADVGALLGALIGGIVDGVRTAPQPAAIVWWRDVGTGEPVWRRNE